MIASVAEERARSATIAHIALLDKIVSLVGALAVRAQVGSAHILERQQTADVIYALVARVALVLDQDRALRVERVVLLEYAVLESAYVAVVVGGGGHAQWPAHVRLQQAEQKAHASQRVRSPHQLQPTLPHTRLVELTMQVLALDQLIDGFDQARLFGSNKYIGILID